MKIMRSGHVCVILAKDVTAKAAFSVDIYKCIVENLLIPVVCLIKHLDIRII
jgi:hypothetical protein